ncbi:hypothetical protein VST63_03685 [Mycolicibacterium sp. 050232]|uniref:hypothetical protein n=1 Tax=Mycolicibacterium sp. 050232 TaxID=3113982 RepID=UPI002E27E6D0|nr:hypothetical protein [Mycolicibacterium sp. 050232]MED5811451.1 hypothetical protein [Mycolicibacterium sp. 050232]
MRTTLDIDERVLAAAKGMARARGITMGQAISELAIAGYEARYATTELGDPDFPVLPAVEGHVITDEMVEKAFAEDA